MRRIPNGLYASLFGVAYLILVTNVLLLVACLPLVLLLVTTDPVLSWPLLAVALPLCAPALMGAAAVFSAHSRGETAVVRTFWRAWRASWRRPVRLLAAATAVVVLVLVDVRFLAPTQIGVVVIPFLAVIALLVVGCVPVALVALAEAGTSTLRQAVKAAVFLAARRWHLSVVSLLVLAFQAYLFTASPALALGVSAAPALYLVWANARFTLRPALAADQPVAA
ncbi:putative membrane protein YesL [Rathayibacter sp. PhB151]|uniref:ferredoxin-NADPH reductase n=1 Tax=Rathayibacter sp. PhB151 TaxID=2485189 RepID=UPI00106296C4|nr:ferredoxin-NADPH reductase [Rathayibacter sp. PhB151]TDX81617.1 putative membrane protein YesL [Rathayibacter sp. PhB151]